MTDHELLRYDEQRNWIHKKREKNIPWDRIIYANNSNESDLAAFLRRKQQDDDWDITVEEWMQLVELERKSEEELLAVSFSEKNSIIAGKDENNMTKAPKVDHSCWRKYRCYLLNDKGYSIRDVDAIEKSSEKILKQLNGETFGKPVKGIVIGNVQSGKTANMAGLISMAADYGWNMFIVLSGTIESLRLQTLDRLVNDLKQPGIYLNWATIPEPAKNCSIEFKAQKQDFSEHSRNRYITVVLKNVNRLTDLIRWLHDDPKSTSQMKILIIDDEADQAGINREDVATDKKSSINELITNLIANRLPNGEKAATLFKAMNYVGYTATPYANILNDAGEESTYPNDFITTLQVSKSYFGPQQIFGDRFNGNYQGLDIVNSITDSDLSKIKNIHSGRNIYELPDSLKDAICWFLCCVSTQRYWNSVKPVSMLIHTSQRQPHHANIHRAINDWLKHVNKNLLISQCKEVWERETAKFTKENLLNNYRDFADADSIRKYPDFHLIEGEIRNLAANITNIKLDDEGTLKYNRGIHLCVDNCSNNKAYEDGTYLRLVYPKEADNLNYATAFIVIGGTTLSRGLTIEGLVSTYFLRSTKQADTLMQMGRWFGYRRGYELLQRIWLTEKAVDQFEFLADMDSELRTTISNMEVWKKKPEDYAVAIRTSPSAQLINITAKNRMQSAIPAAVNFSGIHKQTHLFVHDDAVQKKNYELAESFINSLGKPEDGFGSAGKNCAIWTGIDFEDIYSNLLEPYIPYETLKIFNHPDLEQIKGWIEKATKADLLDKWNVVLYGNEKGNVAEFKYCKVKKVIRTRKSDRKGVIDIRILTDPKEKIADVRYEKLSPEFRKKYDEEYKGLRSQIADIRTDAGLGKTPSIGIYVIDKNSGDGSKSLGVNHDVVGIAINIPGEKNMSGYTESVMIDLSRFGLGTDLEDINEENEN